MDGYQLAALHVLMDTALLVHMLRTGAVQYPRQAKATSTCPGSLWETFGVWVVVCIVYLVLSVVQHGWTIIGSNQNHIGNSKNGGEYYYLLPVVIFANDGGVMCC